MTRKKHDMKTAFAMLAALSVSLVAAHRATGSDIEVGTVLIKVIEQVEVPAREAGVLSMVNVREGTMVSEGEVMAKVDDKKTRLEEARAAIEVALAAKQVQNDIDIRFARKSLEVSQAEVRRAKESIEKYPKSISASEMDRLNLIAQKSELEVEQAEHEHQIASFNQQLKENELQTAQQNVARRSIVAPIAGAVVQLYHRQGEWVTPGETVVRVVRLDRLRAEGFLNIEHLRRPLQGLPVTLTVDLPGEPAATFPGKLVFVSPEIDPINLQVRVWAEVENRGLKLRPGLRAQMSIKVDESERDDDQQS